MNKFRYTEPVTIALLFVTLALHVLGKDHLVDSILMALVTGYLGINLYQRQKK